MEICKEIINILTPFEIAITQCQSQNSVTASLVIPCIRGLKAELDEFSTTSKSKLISTLITSINKRLQRYESNDAFKLATVLDPRWKLDWCLADEVEDIKSLVNDKVASVGPVNDATIDRADTPPAPKKIKLFCFMGKNPPLSNLK